MLNYGGYTMADKQVFELTLEGKQALEAELTHLKDVERPANITALQDARSQGDLSENADYDAAREDQRRIEGRIAEIENILKNVKIIEKDRSSKVSTGKHLVITYVKLNKTFEFDLVGTIEADPTNNKISNESPLGKTLMGHKVGDTVTVVSESGKEFKVTIESVK